MEDLFGTPVASEARDGQLVVSPSVVREGQWVVTPQGRPGDVQALFYSEAQARFFVEHWNKTH